MEDKKVTYLRGGVKMFTFANGGHIINVSLNLDNLAEFANEEGWVNLAFKPRKEKDKWGNTHFITLNEYKKDASDFTPEKENKTPTRDSNGAQQTRPSSYGRGATKIKQDKNDLPF